MSEHEWAATDAVVFRRSHLTDKDYHDFEVDIPNIPEPPGGVGWRLVAAVVCNGRVVWYWERG